MADTPTARQLGESIQFHRKEKNWTQVKLAIELRKEKGTISNWENGKGNVGYKNMLVICVLLDISMKALLGYEK
jgi:transcriptional regulator with XRE-family HTH domain